MISSDTLTFVSDTKHFLSFFMTISSGVESISSGTLTFPPDEKYFSSPKLAQVWGLKNQEAGARMQREKGCICNCILSYHMVMIMFLMQISFMQICIY